MPEKPEQKPADADQSKRFIDMARKVEVDETATEADRIFKKIVKPKPQNDKGR
ncbi:MAG: hypothetical protein WDM94_02495 [Bauldia sp.]